MSKTANFTIKPLKGKKQADSVERMIKRFIRKSKKRGIIKEVRDRRYYKKPSEKRNERNIRIKREMAKNKKIRDSNN